MKSYEKYINQELLNSIKKHIVKDNKVAKEYKGYISSMGASIIQSGLIPTLAFYSEKKSSGNENSDADRTKILEIIQEILKKDKTLFELAIDLKTDSQKLRKLQRDILNVSIALKLALRTFEITK